MHWLILLPYYFFTAIGTSLLLLLLCRLVRARVGSSSLVTAAVILSLIGVAAPLVSGQMGIDDYSTLGFLVLAAASLLLAGLDTLLQPLLPLPADDELAQL